MTMKIQQKNILPVLEERKEATKTEEAQPRAELKGHPKDTVALSSFFTEVSNLKETESGQEAGRAEKVAQLKQQVADGSYQPELDKVADSLLKYIMKDE